MRTVRTPGALIAARYSTDNQDADSIELQVERCTAYCRERGIPVLDVYADYAVSGMKAHRTELDRLLDDLRAGKGDAVVILDQSRMVRSMPRWFELREEISSMGVKVISVTQPFVGGDLRDPSVFMMETTSGMINHMWVLQTRQKVLAKMHHMAQQGQHTGGKPALGYRVENGVLVIDDAEAAVVRRIFREYDEGRSYKQIIDGLNADGIRTKRGNAFGSNSLHDLLHNEKYIGTLVYGQKVYRADGTRNTHSPEGGDVIRRENAVPAIIDRDLFGRVQQRMAQNKHLQGGRPPEKREYPLKGKVFCGECGSAMTVARSVSKGTPYYYYRCARKDRLHDCDCQPIRADKLEEIVLTYVRSIVGSADILEETTQRMKAALAGINRTGAARMQALIDEDRETDHQIANIVDAIAAGAFSKALSDRLTELEAKKAQLRTRIDDLRKQADVAALPAKRIQELFDYIVTQAQTDTAAVFDIVSRVEIYKDHIRIYTSFDKDPSKIKPENTTELLETPGTASGVPIVFITAVGFGIVVKR